MNNVNPADAYPTIQEGDSIEQVARDISTTLGHQNPRSNTRNRERRSIRGFPSGELPARRPSGDTYASHRHTDTLGHGDIGDSTPDADNECHRHPVSHADAKCYQHSVGDREHYTLGYG